MRLWGLALLVQVRLLLVVVVVLLLMVNKRLLLTLRITGLQQAGKILVAGTKRRVWLNGGGHLIVTLRLGTSYGVNELGGSLAGFSV